MALQKQKNHNGFTCNYWRIIQLNTHFDRMDCVIDIALYQSKAAREAGNLPVYSFQHSLGAEFADKLFNGNDKVKNINLQRAYAELKAQAQAEASKPDREQNSELVWFADAADV